MTGVASDRHDVRMPTTPADVPTRTDRAVALAGGAVGLAAVAGSTALRVRDDLAPALSALAAVAFLLTGTALGVRRSAGGAPPSSRRRSGAE